MSVILFLQLFCKSLTFQGSEMSIQYRTSSKQRREKKHLTDNKNQYSHTTALQTRKESRIQSPNRKKNESSTDEIDEALIKVIEAMGGATIGVPKTITKRLTNLREEKIQEIKEHETEVARNNENQFEKDKLENVWHFVFNEVNQLNEQQKDIK